MARSGHEDLMEKPSVVSMIRAIVLRILSMDKHAGKHCKNRVKHVEYRTLRE